MSQPTFWFVEHTHWEGAVFKTREDYLTMGLPHIVMALRLLATQPSFRYVLDQAAYVKPFLERYPEQEAAFRQFLAEGRLQVVGGTDVMADANLPGPETMIRQIQYGKRFFRDKLGVDVTTFWALDTFGHNAQLPQLLKRAGFTSFWFSRGVPHRQLPSEFLWQGLDGTQILAYWLPYSYGWCYHSPTKPAAFVKFFQERFDQLTPHTTGAQRVGLAGHDVCPPESHVAALVEEFNRQPEAAFRLRLAVPADYEAAVAQERRGAPVVVRGELNPIFQGAYSSRIELKQWLRRLDARLVTAEQLVAVTRGLSPASAEAAELAEARGTEAALWRAWEPVLFNTAHDLAAGVMTDQVYEDTVRSYEFSQRLADELIDQSWDAIAGQIDTSGAGIPVIVWNSLGWARTDAAEVEVAFGEPGVAGVRVVDPAGREVLVQVLESQAGEGGGWRQARLAFFADVPALGYVVFHVLPGAAAGPAQRPGNVLETEHYRLTFDPGTGAMLRLLDKSTNREVLAGPGNIVTCQEDKGDLWELYQGLDAASNVAMTRTQPVPRAGEARFSHDETGAAQVRTGPVFDEYHVAHPFGNGSFATTVRLYHGLRRIEIATELRNQDKWVRYQALFPTTIQRGRNVHEIPFGALERPVGIEFPAQNWVDYSDEQHGVALLNEGLPGNLVSDGTLLLSLLRAHTLGAYGYGGGYEPGMGSESGLQLGGSFRLRYALLPHAGDWRAAQVWREGGAFNRPLLARKARPRPGKLPPRWGLLTIAPPNVVLSAWKPGPAGTTILRVYEAAGQVTPGVRVQFHTPVTAAHEADLLEQSIESLLVEHDTVQFDLGAFEIKTIKLHLKGGTA